MQIIHTSLKLKNYVLKIQHAHMYLVARASLLFQIAVDAECMR